MSQLHFIRQAVYALKREYGVPADLYSLVGTTTDLETGQRVDSKTVRRIGRAILLPRRLYGDVVPLIAGGRPVHHGAHVAKSERLVIVDARDYPSNYEPTPEDYLVVGVTRFNIREVISFDHGLAVIMRVEEVVGEMPRQSPARAASSNLNVATAGSGEV